MRSGAGPEARLLEDALAVLQPGFTGPRPPDWLLRRLAEGLVSPVIFGRNVESPEQLASLTAALRAERPDLLVAIDEETGDVTRLEVATGSSYPGNHALGAVDDPDLTERVATSVGAELAAVGVNLNYAPDADVNTNPHNPVIGVRSFGDDPELVGRHTAAFVRGLQSAGVAACVKHFPGHGDTSTDSHLDLPVVHDDLDALRAGPLLPFQAAIAAGTKAVMTAHILLPALSDDPATMSGRLLTGLLRGELGFDGVICTDGIEMRAVSARWGIAEATVRAIGAGADAICVGGGLAGEDTVLLLRYALVQAVREGRLDEHRLHEAAERVRALARWTSEPAAAGKPDRSVGAVAARRALRVRGAVRPLAEPPVVAEFDTVPNIAVGAATPWGVGRLLEPRLPGTTPLRVTPPATGTAADTDELLSTSRGRPLVLAVRNPHRHQWIADALGAMVAERPDAVVVDLGIPNACGDKLAKRGVTVIETHGASRVCGLAAVETLMTGR